MKPKQFQKRNAANASNLAALLALAFAPAAPVQAGPTQLSHEIARGETISEIAQFYRLRTAKIRAANPSIVNIDQIAEGAQVSIPLPGLQTDINGTYTYRVRPGDTLKRIGRWFNIDYKTLANFNGIPDPDKLEVGDVIRIPKSPVSQTRNASTELVIETDPDRMVGLASPAASVTQDGESLAIIAKANDLEVGELRAVNADLGAFGEDDVLPDGTHVKVPYKALRLR